MDAFGERIGDDGFDPLLDLNRDGELDMLDFGLMRARWGKAAVCP